MDRPNGRLLFVCLRGLGRLRHFIDHRLNDRLLNIWGLLGWFLVHGAFPF
jgi:hypothetical protein